MTHWTLKQENVPALEYLRVELEVRARGVHDDLLRDGALITDPQGAADDASELTGGNHASWLQDILHRLPVRLGSVLRSGLRVRSSATAQEWPGPQRTAHTLSADGNPSHPKHPSTEGRRQT